MRIQFPLYKLFLITAAYAAAFKCYGGLGELGVTAAMIAGTAGAALIMVLRNRSDVLRVLVAAAGSSMGGLFYFFTCSRLTAEMLGRDYTRADEIADCAGISIAAIVGAFILTWASRGHGGDMGSRSEAS